MKNDEQQVVQVLGQRHHYCNDQIKSMSSEWLSRGKSGPGPMPCGFLCWPIKHGQLATASQKGQERPAWEQAPWTPPRGCLCPKEPRPDGHRPGCLCHLPRMAHTCSAGQGWSQGGRDWPGPSETSVDRAVLPLAPFLGIRVKSLPHPPKKDGTQLFWRLEGPSQASGGSNIKLFFQCALSLWRGFRRPLKSSALNPC